MLCWITDYIKYVKGNPKKFCNKIKKLVVLVEKLLNRKDIEYKQSDVIAFEKFCRLFKHREGIWAGMPLILNQEQRFISACVLGIKQYDIKHGKWLRYFRELNLFVARKFGKTLFISALSLWLLGFDKEKGAFGEILAENETQSKKLYDLICKSANEECFKLVFKQNKTEKYLYCELSDGKLVYLSGRKKGKQGSNPSFFVNDEANEITNKGQYSDKKQGMGARLQPLAIVISSAGITPESLYEMLYERDEKILNKKVFSDKERIFPIIYEIDETDKVEDENCWIKANPCLDRDLPSLNYLQQLYETSKDDLLEKAKFTAFNLNRPIGASIDFYDMTDIRACIGNISTADIYDTYATGGVDLAEVTDLCNATTVVLTDDGRMITLQAYFIAEERLAKNSKKDNMQYDMFRNLQTGCDATSRIVIVTPGSTVDFHAVTQWYCMLRDEFKISFLKIGYDRAMSNYWVKDMEENGFNHEKVSFDKENHTEERDYGILTAVAQGGFTLSGAIKVIKSLFADRKILVDKNNKLFPYCFYNLKIRIDTNNNMTPHKSKSSGHIDGAIGLFNAYVAYERAKQLPDYIDSIGQYFKI